MGGLTENASEQLKATDSKQEYINIVNSHG